MKTSLLPTVPSAPCHSVSSRLAVTITTCLAVWLQMVLLTGCAIYPMGLSKEQWDALAPAQQAEYQARQAEIDADNRRAAEAARQQREQAALEEWQREQLLLAERYAQAEYGDIVTVTICGGMVAFHGKRFPYEPVSFDLVRGELKQVEFVRQGESHMTTLIEVGLSDDGNTFYFDYPARKRFVAVNHGWDRGREYRPPEIGSHDGHSEAIGISISIKLRPVSRRWSRPVWHWDRGLE